MIIKNPQIFTESFNFSKGDIYISDDKFVPIDGLSTDNEEIINGEGLYAIPGLIDIHLHGAMGYDFCDGTNEATREIALYEATQGVTAFIPATMTVSEEELYNICKTSSSYADKDGSTFLGINLEGPFLSPDKKGAQLEEFIKTPNIELFNRLNKCSNYKIKLITIAPEINGAMEFIDNLKDEVVISLGHSTANYDIAMEAFKRGACHVTHLYNGMPVLHHRDPGIIGAAADRDNCYVELICDGIHIHPSSIRTTFKLFGDDKIILISDSMRATGMCDGKYSLGGQFVNVTDNVATLENGTLAGSVTSLMNCIRKAVSFGIPLESAIKCGTINPAKEIGVNAYIGTISIGKLANLVLLDKELNIVKVIINGSLVS